MRISRFWPAFGVLLMATVTGLSVDFPAATTLPVRAEFPDPLTAFDGKKIATAEEWKTTRRPELKALFQKYMYGRLPLAPKGMRVVVLHQDDRAFGGKGTLREVELQFDYNGEINPTPIRLMIAFPNERKGPVPTFVGPNFGGNHLYVSDPKIRIPDAWMYANYPGVKANKASEAGRGKEPGVWPLELAISRGYAVATFYAGDIQPDRPNVSEGFRGTLPKTEATGDETATIMSWAWGVHRCVDYLTTVPEIDGKRIAAVGHSRLGKTVLLAAAFDDRIALAIPHQAGCGGTGPSRHSDPKAETVKRINTAFPHWFCGNFKTFNEALDKLPFDQHCLAAICAPRPVLFTNATEDEWANPSGQFDMLKRATPVYKLLGVEGLAVTEMPPPGTLAKSRLGYFIRTGKHAMTTPDWQVFLEFADEWLK